MTCFYDSISELTKHRESSISKGKPRLRFLKDAIIQGA